MVTTPITNDAYHIQFLSLVDDCMHELESAESPSSIPMPLVPPLTNEFTTLAPDQTFPTMLGVTSPWIDLGSFDPVVAHVSSQVLNQEIAYAAFCGMNNLIIPGPCGDHNEHLTKTNVAQYARAIAQALATGPYLQLHISLPMHQVGEKASSTSFKSLASRSRPAYSSGVPEQVSPEESWLATWEAWDLIRSVCRYDSRLSVGTQKTSRFVPFVSFGCRHPYVFVIAGKSSCPTHRVETNQPYCQLSQCQRTSLRLQSNQDGILSL